MMPIAPRQAAVMLLVAKSRAAARHRESAIHGAADAHYAKVLIAVSYAFAKGRKAVDKAALKAATTDKQAMSAVDAAPAAIKVALLGVLPPVLLNALAAGGAVGFAKLPKKVRAASMRALGPFKTRFDVTDPNAIAWAKAHAAELAKDLSDTSRDEIRDAIAGALEGDGLDSAYDDILDAVGDGDRAEMIARTEVMDAANEGLAQSWGQAVEAGLLTGDEKKVWIATSGCCDDCEELDGEEVPLDEDFSIGDDPPAHPNCRCTMGISAGAAE